MLIEAHGAVRRYGIPPRAECANGRTGGPGPLSMIPWAYLNAFCSWKALVDFPGNNFSLGGKQCHVEMGLKPVSTNGCRYVGRENKLAFLEGTYETIHPS
jgi:hypothetical protein